MIKKRSTCVAILPRVENVFTSRSMVETVLSCTAIIPLTRHWLLTSVSASDKWTSGGMTPNTCMTNLYLPPIPGGIKYLVLLCPTLSIAIFIRHILRVLLDLVVLGMRVLRLMPKKRFLRRSLLDSSSKLWVLPSGPVVWSSIMFARNLP